MKLLVIVAGGLILALCLWCFLDEEKEVAGLDSVDPAVVLEDSGSGVKRQAGEDSPSLLRTESPAITDSVPAIEIPPEERFYLTCKDKRTGEVVPHADVFVVPSKLIPTSWSNLHDSPDEQDFAEIGERFVANADGQVVVPVEEFSRVCARTDKFMGFKQLSRLYGDQDEVFLEPRRFIDVKVVNQKGQACAAAPVLLRSLDTGWERGRDVMSALTNARGEARFPTNHLRESLPRSFVTLGGQFAEVEVVVVDLSSPPKEVITLVRPDCGRVEVRCGPEALPKDAVCMLASNGLEILTVPVDDGGASFESVGLGLQLWTYLRLPSGYYSKIEAVRFGGPKNKDEVVQVSIDTNKIFECPEFRARLIDALGKPIAGRSVAFFQDQRHQGSLPKTNAKGELEGDFPDSFRSLLWGAEVELVVDLEDGEGRQWAKVPARTIEPGLNDLGEIRFSLMPLLASGQVLDDEGNPLSGGTVSIHLYGGSGRFTGFPGYGIWTFPIDGEGRFVARAPTSEPNLEVRANGAFWQGLPLKVPVGTEDLQVRIERYGRIKLQCRPAPGAGLGSVVLIRRSITTEGREENWSIEADDQGKFLQVMIEGDYDFRLVRKRSGRANDVLIHDFGRRKIVANESCDLGLVEVPAHGLECEIELEPPLGLYLRSEDWAVLKPSKTYKTLTSGRVDVARGQVLKFNVDELPVILELDLGSNGRFRQEIKEQRSVFAFSLEQTRTLKLEVPEGMPEGLRVNYIFSRLSYKDLKGYFIVGSEEERTITFETLGPYKLWLGLGDRMADASISPNELGYTPRALEVEAYREKTPIQIKLETDFLERAAQFQRRDF